jgi:hypothetical protein
MTDRTETRRDPMVLFQRQPPASVATETSQSLSSNIPRWLYKLNTSTKWWMTLAATLGVWTRFPKYEGPFIVAGSIMSVYWADRLKQIIKHERHTRCFRSFMPWLGQPRSCSGPICH